MIVFQANQNPKNPRKMIKESSLEENLKFQSASVSILSFQSHIPLFNGKVMT